MNYGLAYFPRGRVGQTLEKVKLAEDLGFDHFGVIDSQSMFRELYASLGPVAYQTDTIGFGPLVTNPVTRHPVVTASAMATLDEMAPGRTVLGIGSGDSAVYTLGKRPAYLAELEETIRLIKALWRGEPVEYEGDPVHLNWLREANHSPDIPIYMAAEGPKTLEMAGRVADGVVTGLGATPEVVDAIVRQVAEGASQEGRDPDEIEIWVGGHGNIADDREMAIDEIKMAIAASVHHSLQFTMEGKAVPNEYQATLQEIVEQYDSDAHEQLGENPNRELINNLSDEVFDYLVDRYTIAGTPEDCIDKIRQIQALDGVTGVRISTNTEGERDVIARLGREVLPNV